MEEVVKCHLASYESTVHIFLDTERRNHGELQGISGAGCPPKAFQFVSEDSVVALVYDEGIDGELHFTEVDDTVPTLQQKVNLRTIRPQLLVSLRLPGEFLCQDAGNTELVLDLRNVILAKLFEGEAGPCPSRGIVNGIAPEMLVPSIVVF